MKSISIGCVGSRDLTPAELDVCYSVGYQLGKQGIKVVSGGALGADYTFVKGASKFHPENVTLYLPCDGHNSYNVFDGNTLVDITKHKKYNEYFKIANDCHPYFDRIGRPFIKQLFVRNVAIVANSDAIVAFPNSKKWSGTQHTIAVANKLGKQVYLIGGTDFKIDNLIKTIRDENGI